ncbi:MAG: ATP-binding protein [Pseudomonadota bacterium]
MKAESSKNHQYYRSLTRRIVVLMISISIIPLISIGGVTIYYYSHSLKSNTIQYLETIVNKHKVHIDTFLNEKLGDIQTLADSFTIEQLLDNSFLRRRLEVLQIRYGGDFVDLGIIDDKGHQRAYAGPFKLEDARYSEADWFRKAVTKEFFVSDVFLGLRGLPHFIIAIKVRDDEGKLWMIRSTIDIEKFTSLVENITIGRTGHAFILNRNGEFQTEPRFRESGDFSFLNSLLGKDKLRAEVSIVENEKGMGQKVIYAISFLKDGEWMLVCRQDAADAFSSLYHVRRLVIFISLVSFFSALIISFFLTRRLVGRMELADLERIRMTEQVIEAGKLASIGELAAGIAHEVNNPVAIMVEEAGWMGDLLEEEEFQKSDNLGEFRRSLSQIKAQGTRCKQITHKLLSFARKTHSQLSDLQLNELVEEVVGLSQRTARYSNIKIETELGSDVPAITGSPSEVQQVLLNLINNAIDAIGKDGGTVKVSTHSDNDSVVIDVSDTGCGIPEAHIQRVFDPFFTTKPVGKGTGLGLSICYGIVDAMGGRVSVNSAVGKGTTFHVRLPISAKERER